MLESGHLLRDSCWLVIIMQIFLVESNLLLYRGALDHSQLILKPSRGLWVACQVQTNIFLAFYLTEIQNLLHTESKTYRDTYAFFRHTKQKYEVKCKYWLGKTKKYLHSAINKVDEIQYNWITIVLKWSNIRKIIRRLAVVNPRQTH